MNLRAGIGVGLAALVFNAPIVACGGEDAREVSVRNVTDAAVDISINDGLIDGSVGAGQDTAFALHKGTEIDDVTVLQGNGRLRFKLDLDFYDTDVVIVTIGSDGLTLNDETR
jgi:hypothetical protein